MQRGFALDIKLKLNEEWLDVQAMVDSRETKNFMSTAISSQLQSTSTNEFCSTVKEAKDRNLGSFSTTAYVAASVVLVENPET